MLDAMLTRRLARRLNAPGHDAVHTLDLLLGNRTSDRDIRALADRDGRVVVTKDADFVSSHVISGSPAARMSCSAVLRRAPAPTESDLVDPSTASCKRCRVAGLPAM